LTQSIIIHSLLPLPAFSTTADPFQISSASSKHSLSLLRDCHRRTIKLSSAAKLVIGQ
jgi:hypothetical protein